MAASQDKISVYNLADLKNTSDDAIPNYLNSLKFKQSHHLVDVRLGLGYSAFVIAGACFLWDYKFDFQPTKYYTAAAVLLYSILNGALTIWIWAVEAGTVYVGTSPDGETVRIASTARKNVPEYHLTVTVTDKMGGESKQVIRRPFNQWFDAAGRFVSAPFQQMLASSIPAVAKCHPKQAVPDQAAAYSSELLDAVSAAPLETPSLAAETVTGSEGLAKKGGKRRKA